MILLCVLAFGGLGYSAGDEIFIINVTQAMNNPEAPYSFWLPILGLVYLAVISQWWGFRFWYQAMAEAGAGRISQIQLL